jgi:hypothetical protein
LFTVLLTVPAYTQDAKISFSSDDQALVNGFVWAKQQAMAYVFRNNDPVGPWYEATLPKREAFCIRDLSHQLVGADLLAAQFIGNLDYSKMLQLKNQTRQAKEYLNRASKIKDYLNSDWCDTDKNCTIITSGIMTSGSMTSR